MIQSEIKRSWQGIDAQRTGIPGNSNIVNNKYKRQENSESMDKDQEMFQILFKMACKIKELEELKEIRSAHVRFNKVQKQYEFQNMSTASSGISIPGLNGQ